MKLYPCNICINAKPGRSIHQYVFLYSCFLSVLCSTFTLSLLIFLLVFRYTYFKPRHWHPRSSWSSFKLSYNGNMYLTQRPTHLFLGALRHSIRLSGRIYLDVWKENPGLRFGWGWWSEEIIWCLCVTGATLHTQTEETKKKKKQAAETVEIITLMESRVKSDRNTNTVSRIQDYCREHVLLRFSSVSLACLEKMQILYIYI